MQHDRVSHEVHVLDLLGLLHRVPALQNWAAEPDLVEKVVVGLDLGGLCADALAKVSFGDVTQ